MKIFYCYFLEQLQGLQATFSGLFDQSTHGALQLIDDHPLPRIGDCDLVIQGFRWDVMHVLAAGWTAFRVASLAWLILVLFGWLALAHLIVFRLVVA